MRISRVTATLSSIGLVLALVGASCSSADDPTTAALGGSDGAASPAVDADSGLDLRSADGDQVPGDAASAAMGEATDDADGSIVATPSPPTLSPGAAEEPPPSETPPPETPPSTTSTTTPTVPTSTTLPPSTEAPPPESPPSSPPPSEPPPAETPPPTQPPEETTPPTEAPPPPPGDDLGTGEDHSLVLLNQLRSGLGLNPLTEDGTMNAFARDWSRQMAETGRFEHSNGPYGENIAFTSDTRLSAAEAAELFHSLWVDSPGHYANMTNGGYTTVGVGLYRTERGWYGTHVFKF